MSGCERLSDRMPVVASGASAWGAEESAHLERCEWCRSEWEVVRAAAALGRDLPLALDPHHVAQRVVGRLRAAGEQSRRRRLWIAGAVAAAVIALAVATGPRGARPSRGPSARPADVGALAIPLPELDSLQADELQAVLESLDQPDAAGPNAGDDGDDLNGMDPSELESVLRSMEG